MAGGRRRHGIDPIRLPALTSRDYPGRGLDDTDLGRIGDGFGQNLSMQNIEQRATDQAADDGRDDREPEVQLRTVGRVPRIVIAGEERRASRGPKSRAGLMA